MLHLLCRLFVLCSRRSLSPHPRSSITEMIGVFVFFVNLAAPDLLSLSFPPNTPGIYPSFAYIFFVRDASLMTLVVTSLSILPFSSRLLCNLCTCSDPRVYASLQSLLIAVW